MQKIDHSGNRIEAYHLITITYDGGRMILDPIAFVINHSIKVLKIAHDREEVVNEILRRLEKAKADLPAPVTADLVRKRRRLERAKQNIGRLVES